MTGFESEISFFSKSILGEEIKIFKLKVKYLKFGTKRNFYFKATRNTITIVPLEYFWI